MYNLKLEKANNKIILLQYLHDKLTPLLYRNFIDRTAKYNILNCLTHNLNSHFFNIIVK